MKVFIVHNGLVWNGTDFGRMTNNISYTSVEDAEKQISVIGKGHVWIKHDEEHVELVKSQMKSFNMKIRPLGKERFVRMHGLNYINALRLIKAENFGLKDDVI